jgi:GxxExxY protein
MGKLFKIHEDLGRLFDEQIYRRELLQCLPEAHVEVLVEVNFDSFSKRYYLDILFQGAIFELKAVEAFAPRHRAQLLNGSISRGRSSPSKLCPNSIY